MAPVLSGSTGDCNPDCDWLGSVSPGGCAASCPAGLAAAREPDGAPNSTACGFTLSLFLTAWAPAIAWAKSCAWRLSISLGTMP